MATAAALLLYMGLPPRDTTGYLADSRLRGVRVDDGMLVAVVASGGSDERVVGVAVGNGTSSLVVTPFPGVSLSESPGRGVAVDASAECVPVALEGKQVIQAGPEPRGAERILLGYVLKKTEGGNDIARLVAAGVAWRVDENWFGAMEPWSASSPSGFVLACPSAGLSTEALSSLERLRLGGGLRVEAETALRLLFPDPPKRNGAAPSTTSNGEALLLNSDTPVLGGAILAEDDPSNWYCYRLRPGGRPVCYATREDCEAHPGGQPVSCLPARASWGRVVDLELTEAGARPVLSMSDQVLRCIDYRVANAGNGYLVVPGLHPDAGLTMFVSRTGASGFANDQEDRGVILVPRYEGLWSFCERTPDAKDVHMIPLTVVGDGEGGPVETLRELRVDLTKATP